MPKNGQLAELRKFTRAKYHWASKQVKCEKDNIILKQTAQQLVSKSFREFWVTIKKLNRNNRVIATVIDNRNSEDNIADLFREKYSDLYNSVSDENFKKTSKAVENVVAKRVKQVFFHHQAITILQMML